LTVSPIAVTAAVGTLDGTDYRRTEIEPDARLRLRAVLAKPSASDQPNFWEAESRLIYWTGCLPLAKA